MWANFRHEYKVPGITVNTRGESFYDEGETKHSYTLRQNRTRRKGPARRASRIRSTTIPASSSSVRAPMSAPKVLRPAPLPNWLRRSGSRPRCWHGRAVQRCLQQGRPVQSRRVMDGKNTIGTIWVKRTHWANPIETPPFRAYPIVCVDHAFTRRPQDQHQGGSARHVGQANPRALRVRRRRRPVLPQLSRQHRPNTQRAVIASPAAQAQRQPQSLAKWHGVHCCRPRLRGTFAQPSFRGARKREPGIHNHRTSGFRTVVPQRHGSC